MQIKGTAYTDPEEIKYRLMQTMINQYRKKYPVDWEKSMEEIKQKRANLKDSRYGTSGGDANRRAIAAVPIHLNNLLETIDPEYDKGLKAYSFYKRFPMFLIVEKI
jgi:hypothetical protein